MKIKNNVDIQQNLVDQVNETNRTTFAKTDLVFGNPSAVSGVNKTSVTALNTNITVTAAQTSNFEGSTTLRYRRIHMPTQWDNIIRLSKGTPSSPLPSGVTAEQHNRNHYRSVSVVKDIYAGADLVTSRQAAFTYFNNLCTNANTRLAEIKKAINDVYEFHPEGYDLTYTDTDFTAARTELQSLTVARFENFRLGTGTPAIKTVVTLTPKANSKLYVSGANDDKLEVDLYFVLNYVDGGRLMMV